MALHGGPDALGVPVHDFSTNANACGPGPTARDAVLAADATRYPDPRYAALRERLAAFHDVDGPRIVLAGSASEFVVRITCAVAAEGAGARDGTVRVPLHAYGDYAQAARAQGLAVSVDGCGASAPRLAWACEPATPTGQDEPDLAARLEAWPKGRPLVLDRAYEPLRLSGACGLAPQALDRAWQLWSPNKALGLTGVRGAYAIAPVDAPAAFLSRLEALAPSWPLGAHAVAMLQAWTEPATQAWLAACRPVLADWKRQLQQRCASMGWEVLPGHANFICARWPGAQPMAAVLDHLRARGIKLRDCASFGLEGHVRLGVLPLASQDALVCAWRHRPGKR